LALGACSLIPDTYLVTAALQAQSAYLASVGWSDIGDDAAHDDVLNRLAVRTRHRRNLLAEQAATLIHLGLVTTVLTAILQFPSHPFIRLSSSRELPLFAACSSYLLAVRGSLALNVAQLDVVVVNRGIGTVYLQAKLQRLNGGSIHAFDLKLFIILAVFYKMCCKVTKLFGFPLAIQIIFVYLQMLTHAEPTLTGMSERL
jgi:hypothetical protein